jgi:hypothetical protein
MAICLCFAIYDNYVIRKRPGGEKEGGVAAYRDDLMIEILLK